jgi:hypothetical protein
MITKKTLIRAGLLASLAGGLATVAAVERTASAASGLSGLVPLWLWTVAWTSPHPPLPQVLPVGGPTLTTPRVVPVLYASDGNLTALEDFASKLGTSTYLTSVTAEYGVTGVTVTAPVVLQGAPPATALDTAVATWLQGQLANPAFPQSDGQTIYALVYPQGTAVSVTDAFGNVSPLCGGHHAEATAADGSSIPFTLTGFCANLSGLTPVDFATKWTATAIVDAITNPSPTLVAPGYDDTDFAGSGWAALTGPEVGLLCPQSESSARPTDLGYLVPRVYSNVAAAGGHDPCLPVPASATPYFNAAPVLDGDDNLVRGVIVPPGGSTTVPLALFSDGEAGRWKLSAVELPGLEATPSLSFSFDENTGTGGSLRFLTIRRAAPAPGTVAAPVLGVSIVSSDGTTTHEWLVNVSP